MTARIEVEVPAADAAREAVIHLSGDWTLEAGPPGGADVLDGRLDGVARVRFSAAALGAWDSRLPVFLRALCRLLAERGVAVDRSGLPEGAQRLLALAEAVPARTGPHLATGRRGFLERLGEQTREFAVTTGRMLAFLGDVFLAVGSLVRARARFRTRDFLAIVQETGAEAFPIVSLISLLVGMVLAFVGAVQLRMFGAEIYVASLVGISMIRVMGAIMTGIIMAGRTGAAFAARLGTMQVNEEIDALRTLGISPMEFLVLPRILALVLMLPLLCVYADIMGVMGGLLVAVGMLDISVAQYMAQTWASVRPQDLWIGLVHGVVFGVLVALAGCMHGMHCGRSASAVGDATTSAVVTGIVAIIVATADAISGARPGARRESLESYIKRVTALEEIAKSFPGVEEAYAIQAGREVRIIVKPEEIDDLGVIELSREIAQKVEDNMEYPGQIKITVIREMRATEYAK